MPNNRDYTSWDKNELVAYINHLENNLRKENNDFLVKYKWAGNLGQWLWHYQKDLVIFNDQKLLSIGYNPDEIGPVGFNFFTQKLHPDDYERVMDNMRMHLNGKTLSYEVEYRIKHRDGHYVWYYDRGVITKRDDNGKPLLIEGIVFDITTSKLVEEQLKNLSELDTLTNLYNRRILYKTINTMIKLQSSKLIPFSIIMFDIDNFKLINDTYGHIIGDDVLVKLANLIQDNKRVEDEVFRYGGEEFIILLPNTNLATAVTIGKDIHKLISGFFIPPVGSITVSMGVTQYVSDETVDMVINRVDNLLYKAKKAGKNNVKY